MELKKTLESPLDCKDIKQSILKEINSEYPLEGLMLKLKLQYFGDLMQRADSLEKTLTLGKTSQVAQMVKHLTTMWETQARSLCWEVPLEKEIATYSRTLA